MKLRVLLALLIIISPAFAAGNLTVNSTNMAPSVINKGVLTNMLNLSLNSTEGDTNLTGINITIGGSASIGNVTLVALINSTGSLIASNSTNSTSLTFIIYVPGGINVTNGTTKNILIALNTSLTATTGTTLSVNIDSNSSFFVDAGSNVSLSVFSNSSAAQIRSHSNVTVAPRIVDTSVINQTFNYTFLLTSSTQLNNFSINLPENYTVSNVTAVYQSGIIRAPITDYSNTTTPTQVNISLTSSATSPVNVIFTANTPNSTQTGDFTSMVSGPALPWTAADPVNVTVVAKQLLVPTSIWVMKSTAIINGSDYWEFSFNVNITDAVTGMLQFRMANWNNSAGQSMALTSGTSYFANIRNTTTFNSTTALNVTNSYSINTGLSYSTASPAVVSFILRMVIPLGTSVSQTWYTTYNMLFRSS